jgi:hypothetical protein
MKDNKILLAGNDDVFYHCISTFEIYIIIAELSIENNSSILLLLKSL